MRKLLYILLFLTTKAGFAQSNYCLPTTSCYSSDYISKVTFNTINRSSSCDGGSSGGYSFYNSLPNITTVQKGNNYTLSVNTSPSFAQGIAAWIDYNHNNIFDVNEKVLSGFLGNAGAAYSGNIVIPDSALEGVTRLRIRCKYNDSVTSACLSFTFGETEDYLIIIESNTCVPPTLNLTGDTTACGSVILTASGGTSYFWTGGTSPNAATDTFTISGLYYVYATNTDGCTAIASRMVTVKPVIKPDVTISANDTGFVCAGTAVTFTAIVANGDNATIFKWRRNGVDIANASGNTYITDSLTNNDQITCSVYNDCSSDTSNVITTSIVTTSQTPSVIISVSSSDTINYGMPATFKAAPTLGGSSPSYQWKVNGVNVGSNSPTYTSNVLKNKDIVTCVLTSSAGCATPKIVSSNAITITVGYCIPTSNSCSYNIYINKVTFNTIHNNSGCGNSANGYSYYNTDSNTTTVNKGNEYLLSVSTSGPYSQGVAAWIDYNQDNVFEANEILLSGFTGSAGAVYSSNISIPATAFTGTTRLRIRSIYDDSPADIPCGNVSYGETEDYLIKIDSIPCTPPAIFVTGDTISCGSVTLTASGGVSYVWSGGSSPNTATNTFTSSGTYIVQVADSSGCTAIAYRIVTVYPVAKPDITISANDTGLVCAGTAVTFTATVVNSGNNPTFKWRRNGVDIANAAGQNYVTDSLADNDQITCAVYNDCSSDTSNIITAAITTTPQTPSVTISVSPSDTINFGAIATFKAIPTLGGASPSFQWKLNGANVGTNSPTFTTSSLNNQDVITCVLTSSAVCANPASATSNAITIIVTYCLPVANCNLADVITKVVFNTINRTSGCDGSSTGGYSYYSNAPNTTTVHKGQSYVLSVNTGPAFAQGVAAWIDYNHNYTFDANELVLSGYAGYSGAIYTGTVTIPLAALNGATRLRIRCRFAGSVNDPCSSVSYGETEDYLIGIDSVSCTPPIVIITGDTTSCGSVTLTASGGVSYFWSGGLSPNTATNTFTLSGTYSVLVADSLGCTAVAYRIVTVKPVVKPDVTISANDTGLVCVGTPVTFTATVVNAGNSPIFKWRKNGVDINNAAAQNYVTDSLINNDKITCVVYNDCSSDTSNIITTAIITTSQSPSVTISVSPSDTISSGTTVTFKAAPILGGSSPYYQWKLNGVNVGSNSPIFTPGSLNNQDVVTCVLTSSAVCANPASVTSNAITIVVTYCLPVTNCNLSDVITKVVFNTINRNSGCDGSSTGGYSYYSNAPNTTTVNKGQSYALSVNTGPAFAQGVAAWIDYNHNYIFDANELVLSGYAGYSGAIYTGTVTIPLAALNGATRLRIRCRFAGSINDPCSSISYGETEDYLIGIDSVSCIPPTVIITGDTTSCGSVTLTASGGVSYFWSGGLSPNTATNTFTSSGTYSVLVADSSGCTAVAYRIATVYPVVKPDITISANDTGLVCAGTAVIFTATVANSGNTPIFKWRRNGVDIANAAGQNYVTDSLADNDQITCAVYNDCSSDTSNIITAAITTTPQTPSVTISVSPSDTINSGTLATFKAIPTLSGASPSFQWKLNGADVGNNSPTYTNINLKNKDVVTCVLTSSAICASPSSVTSNAITVVVNYCLPIANCNASDIITKVVFNTINRTSGCDGSSTGGYSYYGTAPNTTTVHKGQSYALSVSTGTAYVQGIGAWIDYNRNNIFDAGELVLSGFTGNSGAIYSGNVTIPVNALTGPTRLRIRCRFAGSISDPCSGVSFGETEDYLITIDSVPSDLIVDSLSIPSTGFQNQPITISWKVKNTGEGTTKTGSWTDRVYFTASPVYNPGSALAQYDFAHNGILFADSSYIQTQDIQLPANISGWFYIHVFTDIGMQIAEDSAGGENNNLKISDSFHVFTTMAPDLIVTKVTSPATGSAGQKIRVTWNVSNQGATGIHASSWQDSLYICPGAVFNYSNAVPLRNFIHSGDVEVNSSYTASAQIILPNLTPGNYYIYVFADANKKVPEVDDSNNSGRSNLVQITAADLRPVNIVASSISKSVINNPATLNLVPNPAHNVLNVYTTGLPENKKMVVSVISASGLVMKRMKLTGATKLVRLNISSFANGVYIIKIESDDKVMYKQFVKF